jgi:hypothetical protein
MPVELVLEAFESAVTMSTLGALDSSAVPEISGAHAEAVLEVDLNVMKSVFKYQTDSADVVDVDASDLKYYVDTAVWPTLNPANAKVGTGIIGSGFDEAKKMVAHDFTRHLAKGLFGTHQGVDLFNNELDLLNNLRLICGADAAGQTWYEIKETLKAVNKTAVALTDVDGSGDKYTTNADDSNDNICRVLLRQMASEAKDRFQQIVDSDAPQSLPFMENDVISFKLNINPAEGQNELTDVAELSDRSYKIKLLMKAAPSNTAVGEDEPAPAPV